MNKSELQLLATSLGCREVKMGVTDLTATCPLHEDHRPSFSISAVKMEHPWNCFVCGGGASIRSLVMRKFDIDKESATRHILRFGSVTIPDGDSPTFQNRKIRGAIFTGQGVTANSLRTLYEPCVSYRNISPKTLREAEILEDTKMDAIIVLWYSTAVCGHKDKSFLGATMHPKKKGSWYKAQVLTEGLIPMKHLLILNRRLCIREKRLVLVEGIHDLLKVLDTGIAGAAAISSSHLTPEQINEILSLGFNTLVFALDPDSAGNRGTLAALDDPRLAHIRKFLVTLPSDPGDMETKDLRMAIERAHYAVAGTQSRR